MPYCEFGRTCACFRYYCCSPDPGRKKVHCRKHENGCHMNCKKKPGRKPKKT